GFQLSWKESLKMANQCKPILGMIDTDTVQECKTLPLNGPTQGLQLTGGAYLGLAAIKGSDLWRIALGPTFIVDFASGASTTYQVGGQVPIYFSITKATGFETEYQGIVRIMPTILAERVDGVVGANVSLTLALLGKRKMFGSGIFFP